MQDIRIQDSPTRTELRAVLLEEHRYSERLLELLDDPKVSPLELAAILETLERIHDRETRLLQGLREEASFLRRREEERSVRRLVLEALGYIDSPQSSGFIQEFVWATQRIDLNTRGFGALRRDEARAWQRNPGHRIAYVVPALSPDGQAQSRWMARSDWALPRRIVVSDAPRLFVLQRIRSLFRARGERSGSELTDPFASLIARYAAELGDGTLVDEGGEQFEPLRKRVETEFRELEPQVAHDQEAAAKKMSDWPLPEQLWGK